jgi:PAS domain S-box-containing protein
LKKNQKNPVQVRKPEKPSADQYAFDRFFELVPDLVCIASTDGYFKELNPAWEQTLGFTSAELLNQPIFNFVHPEDVEATQREIEKQIQGQGTFHFLNRYRTKDGSYRWLEWNSAPSKDGILLYAAARDITEQKQMEEALKSSEDRYHAMFEQAGDGVFILDTQGRILSINKTFAQMHGFTVEEMLQIGLDGLDVEGTAPVPERLRRILAGETLTFEVEHYHKDGHTFPLTVTSKLISSGSTQLIMAIHRDITERKRAEKALLQANERLALAQHSSGAGIWDWDMTTGKLAWSPELFQVFRLDPQSEPSFEAWRQILLPEDRSLAEEWINTAIREHAPLNNEYRILWPSGEVRWINALGDTLYDEQGTPQRMSGICIDITARKHSEIALYFTQNAVDHMADAAFWIRADGSFAYVNEAASRSLGYTREELLQLQISTIDPNYAETIWPAHRQELQQKGNLVFETLHRRKTGECFPVEVRANFLHFQGEEYNCVIARDITERRQMEIALGASEQKHVDLLNNLNAGVVVHAPDTSIVYHNERACELLGLTPEQMRGKQAMDPQWRFVCEDGTPMPLAQYPINQVLITSSPLQNFIVGIRQATTEKVHWVLVNGLPIWDAPGKLQSVIITFVDITELKQAEKALKQSEENYRLLVESMNAGVFQSTLTGQFLQMNSAVAAIAGYDTVDELMSKPASSLYMDLADRERLVEALKRKDDVRNLEVRLVKKDGTPYWVSLNAVLQKDQDGGPEKILGIINDITGRKQADEALQKSEALLNRVQEFAHLGSWELDLTTHTVIASDEAHRVYGIPKGSMTQEFIQSIPLPEFRPLLDAALNALITRGQRYDVDFKIRRASDGEIRDIHSLAEYNAARRTIIGSIQDITERKQTEEQIKKSLAEKETLLRELYHRTKNNMAVIIALLELQAGALEDERLQKEFSEAQNRIRAMALVHQKLYDASDLSHINLKDYIHELVLLMLKSYSIDPAKITVTAEMEEVFVLIDSAIPCGLILNELLSNTLKYAFSPERGVEIKIQLHRAENGAIELHIADNGVGVPPGFNFRRDGHLGLQNVFTLGEGQLRGQVVFETHPGVACQLRFQDTFYKPRV